MVAALTATQGSKSHLACLSKYIGSKTRRAEPKLEATRIPAFAHICTHEVPINSTEWITFQLLSALRDARSRKLIRGDIKSKAILVTSWIEPTSPLTSPPICRTMIPQTSRSSLIRAAGAHAMSCPSNSTRREAPDAAKKRRKQLCQSRSSKQTRINVRRLSLRALDLLKRSRDQMGRVVLRRRPLGIRITVLAIRCGSRAYPPISLRPATIFSRR
ncbi:hypothetical protein FIBSPDRAFT_958217 [Athelia psychrophila]|uniref:Uncharacterized protein n=1 Tax=Athelia psychrophila TaxID=1759441 RepID=A0A166EWM0_9AGAM|nr:hypothetical protein FIBSPDRAFT_958217 [Fibularhizoctonia sp. CBS 109695]